MRHVDNKFTEAVAMKTALRKIARKATLRRTERKMQTVSETRANDDMNSLVSKCCEGLDSGKTRSVKGRFGK